VAFRPRLSAGFALSLFVVDSFILLVARSFLIVNLIWPIRAIWNVRFRQELPSIANELDAAVVVMGAVSRNGWKRLFIGATAERTLEYLPYDLLIIKPDRFRTPVTLEAHEAA